jgi:SAM-dependent methyltransferase
MAKVRPYYAEGSLSVAFYDVLTDADRTLDGDADLYAGLAAEGGSVLELGTGSGRLAQALAERGFQVTGVDIAPPMLAKAQARRAGLPAQVAGRIALVRGDMAALDLKRRFDLVICPFFTLAHTPAGSAWRNTFATAARHLEPGGAAAFHLPRADVMASAPPVPDRPVFDQVQPDGRRLLLFVRERSFKPAIGRMDQVIEYIVLDGAGQTLARSPERLTYYMTDPVPLAATAGLALDGQPQALGGDGDIWVFRKR